MNRKQIMEELVKIFRDIFDDESIMLNNDTTAADLEDWDSLMHITLITAIEDHFHIKFKLKEVTGIQNVGQTIGLIEEKLSE